jgi:phosphotransferase system, enzyme I, PtsP
MIAPGLPRLDEQVRMYRQVLDAAKGKRVVFRALDIGGDKTLPYLRHPAEENPALGWRASRLLLDRSALLRLQMRALLIASDGRELNLMMPMITQSSEIDRTRGLIEREIDWVRRRGDKGPSNIRIGAMIEVPSVLFTLDSLLNRVDFVSVGSNDLMQFLFAADRGNPRVAQRYGTLSAAALRALKTIQAAGTAKGVPVTLCGEMAARPLECMALIGLGYRSLSVSPASIGPAKAMIRSLSATRITARVEELLARGEGDNRGELKLFAESEGVEL